MNKGRRGVLNFMSDLPWRLSYAFSRAVAKAWIISCPGFR
ncbi:hypothetical protein HMPREF1502_2155 [Klebsiella sp. AS10]|nr:hypothetical protein A225_2339 [Klebsiella michiganensis E718]EUB39032.1 hypothetical protein HMPREF1502_2155 [Klebsiella sp. AS10]